MTATRELYRAGRDWRRDEALRRDWEELTIEREPAYVVGLARMNWDRFGADEYLSNWEGLAPAFNRLVADGASYGDAMRQIRAGTYAVTVEDVSTDYDGRHGSLSVPPAQAAAWLDADAADAAERYRRSWLPPEALALLQRLRALGFDPTEVEARTIMLRDAGLSEADAENIAAHQGSPMADPTNLRSPNLTAIALLRGASPAQLSTVRDFTSPSATIAGAAGSGVASMPVAKIAVGGGLGGLAGAVLGYMLAGSLAGGAIGGGLGALAGGGVGYALGT